MDPSRVGGRRSDGRWLFKSQPIIPVARLKGKVDDKLASRNDGRVRHGRPGSGWREAIRFLQDKTGGRSGPGEGDLVARDAADLEQRRERGLAARG